MKVLATGTAQTGSDFTGGVWVHLDGVNEYWTADIDALVYVVVAVSTGTIGETLTIEVSVSGGSGPATAAWLDGLKESVTVTGAAARSIIGPFPVSVDNLNDLFEHVRCRLTYTTDATIGVQGWIVAANTEGDLTGGIPDVNVSTSGGATPMDMSDVEDAVENALDNAIPATPTEGSRDDAFKKAMIAGKKMANRALQNKSTGDITVRNNSDDSDLYQFEFSDTTSNIVRNFSDLS